MQTLVASVKLSIMARYWRRNTCFGKYILDNLTFYIIDEVEHGRGDFFIEEKLTKNWAGPWAGFELVTLYTLGLKRVDL